MNIIVTSASPTPLYEQIEQQIKNMILSGELTQGAAMPSIRLLAKELRVSIITVKRAYDDLARDGFIVTVPAKGTFVSTQNQDFIREENLRRIEKLLSDAAALGRENGLSLNELKATLEVVYADE